MLLRIARIAESGVRRTDLRAAFGVGRAAIQRAVNKLRDHGEASFFGPRRGRGTSVIVGEVAQTAVRLLASGMSGAVVARKLKIPATTLNYNRRKGFISDGRPEGGRSQSGAQSAKPATSGAPEMPGAPGAGAPGGEQTEQDTPDLLDRSARDQRDRAAPMGRGARDTAGRVAASTGALLEAQPCFDEPISAVACGGVLAALPILLKEGLLERAHAFLSAPKGYYGLTSVLVLLALVFMPRVRNPEALRHEAPGEWGAILGLDRCPETKALRRKARMLGSDVQQVRNWQDALARAWMKDQPDIHATVSVDGHVKVYSGRKGRLPKHFVSRQKLCLPASTSYWINALGGTPLLCLNKDLDPRMTRMLEHDILPALEAPGVAGPDAPDLTVSHDAEPALTLVFDREGWSPALFARRGIAVITWHTGFAGEDWPQDAFPTVEVPIHGSGATRTGTVRLAEKRIRVGRGPEVRQIRRLLDTVRQVPLVTTDRRIPMENAAGALFSRWAQESVFKSMREEFNLDALPVHGLVEPDPETRVINPAWRELDSRTNRLRSQLGTLRNRIADLLGRSASEAAATVARKLQAESETLDAECVTLTMQRREVAKHIRAGQLEEHEKHDVLPSGEKLFLDIIRMIAYRAETRMMSAVAVAQGKKQRPRRPLSALFQSDADIIPDPEKAILRVRILGTASNAGDAAIAGLLEELNQTNTLFPGPNLRLVYELPGNGETTGEPVS